MNSKRSRVRRVLSRRALWGATLLLGIGVAGGCHDHEAGAGGAAARQTAAEASPSEVLLPQYERFGYYAARPMLDKSFHVKDVAATGMAGRLTVLAYAYGNLDPKSLTCSMRAKPGEDPEQEYIDYQEPFDASNSVDGVADAPAEGGPADGGPLRGNFNQLRKLKARFPRLKVVISLGGGTPSKVFSDAAASEASRRKLVASCIDLYIKGDLPPGHGSGGKGSAAGVFDGFDLAWQWPGAADKANHALLLQEFRRQLDALGGSHYLLTALLPADPAKIAAGIDTGGVFQALDFGNVQGYDFHGPWVPTRTGHHAQLFPSPGDPTPASARLSGNAALRAYMSAGVAPNRLTLGVPLYGYGWTGVYEEGPEWGLFQKASGLADGIKKTGTAPVKDLLRRFPPLRLELGSANGKHLRLQDPITLATYGYDGTNFWSFDDPLSLQLKVSYIQTVGLRGAMLWSLDGDDGSLVAVLDQALNNPPPDE